MRQRLSRAGWISVLALGVLGFSAGGAAADNTAGTIMGHVPTTTTSTTPNSFFAPLWVFPSVTGVPPIMVAPGASGPQVLVIRDEPSLLTPADLHFSTDQENGVTVVRGPLAR